MKLLDFIYDVVKLILQSILCIVWGCAWIVSGYVYCGRLGIMAFGEKSSGYGIIEVRTGWEWIEYGCWKLDLALELALIQVV